MILTGDAIIRGVEGGDISISPFDKRCVNPNSYNYHLADRLLLISDSNTECSDVVIPESGYILYPGRIYLGSTFETIGSQKFAMTLLGRSSIGRLGIFLNITADLGHVGSCSNWTLEITVVHPVRIYPGMKIGQVAFWLTRSGLSKMYSGRYHRDTRACVNLDPDLQRPTK